MHSAGQSDRSAGRRGGTVPLQRELIVEISQIRVQIRRVSGHLDGVQRGPKLQQAEITIAAHRDVLIVCQHLVDDVSTDAWVCAPTYRFAGGIAVNEMAIQHQGYIAELLYEVVPQLLAVVVTPHPKRCAPLAIAGACTGVVQELERVCYKNDLIVGMGLNHRSRPGQGRVTRIKLQQEE